MDQIKGREFAFDEIVDNDARIVIEQIKSTICKASGMPPDALGEALEFGLPLAIDNEKARVTIAKLSRIYGKGDCNLLTVGSSGLSAMASFFAYSCVKAGDTVETFSELAVSLGVFYMILSIRAFETLKALEPDAQQTHDGTESEQ